MLRKLQVIQLLFFVFLLSACTSSLQDKQQDVKELLESSVTAESEKPNKETDDIRFYLPFAMKMNESDANNILVTKGDQIFILFINKNEKEDSRVVYEAMLKEAISYTFTETFTNKNKFGYVFLKETNKDEYELTVGIGGYKMTTMTDIKRLTQDAETMMKVVSSIELKG
ncbi:hypothetical protein ABET36_05250 [Caldifermentibacillus hisashii]|uniref:hypothetical protein n=1 Tax=Caldifermentibacillus hisashii TaxID=996558 RepID=UPI0034D76D4B